MPAQPRLPGQAEKQRLLGLLSRPWTLEILLRLEEGPARYTEISDATGRRASDRTITDRLQALSELKLIERHVDKGPPTVITYSAARKLGPVLEQVRRFPT